MKALLFAVLLTLGLACGPAQADPVRHPATGAPAITVDLPSSWSQSVDASNNLIITTADRTVAYSITVGTDPRSADVIAAETMQLAGAGPLKYEGPTMISPAVGGLYTSTLLMKAITLNVRMSLVKPDADHFVSVTRISNPSATEASLNEAAAVLATMRIVQ